MSPLDPASLRPGARLARFEVRGLLGKGGCGAVFRVWDPQTEREVALKLISGALEPDQLLRFRREGEVTAALDHPGIVRVHERGNVGRAPYLVYELVEGCETLGQRCQRADRPERLRLVLETARAIAHAHARGVVHRDLKPENVLVDPQGRVRVTDFGIALPLAALREEARLTRSGAILGTPTHMAPEQFLGRRERIGPHTDTWALGVVLYTALTDALPYWGHNLLELGAQIARGAHRPPRELDPSIPPALAAVCSKALQPDPAARYPDAGTLAQDLAAAIAGKTVTALPPAGRGGRWRVALAAGLLGACGLGLWLQGFVVAQPEPPRPTPPPTRSPAPPAPASEPDWYRALAPPARPPLPLPRGLRFGLESGEYLHERDGSILVWIPPGRFQMGSDDGDVDERPPQEVAFAAGFFFGKYEVTWKQFRAFAAATGAELPLAGFRRDPNYALGPRHPVHRIRWEQARAYAEWAGLRLPSEAEWEYAARGPHGRRYPWGDSTPWERKANLRGEADGFRFTAPVGSFPAGVSPFGVHDLCGNVSEWTRDEYGAYGLSADAEVLPGVVRRRVVRGGSWYGRESRAANRNAVSADSISSAYGIRVCRSGS